jgi:hypothetical protein
VKVMRKTDIVVDAGSITMPANLEHSAKNLVPQTAQHIAGSEESTGPSVVSGGVRQLL